jgi:plasmid maintenance system killer protein
VHKLPADIQQRARRKLRMLDAALDLQDLRVPPYKGATLHINKGEFLYMTVNSD